MTNKDALEKQRLAARDFGFVRNEVVENPVRPAEGTPLFATNKERFHGDFVAEERSRREQKLNKYDAKLTHKAERNEMRETRRWERMEKEFSKEQEWLRELQSRPAANTNKNSIPVNPITLQYLQTPEGAWKRYEDDKVRHRAARRSDNLYRKMHSVEFDIITGQPKPSHQVPQVPPPPQPPTA